MKLYLLRLFCVFTLTAFAAPARAAMDELQSAVPGFAEIKAPAPKGPIKVQYYYLNRDQENKIYAYYDDSRIQTDGKAIEARLKAAGYVVTGATLKKVNGTPYNYDYNYEYVIEYTAPEGFSPENLRYYYLNRDQESKVYAYYDDARIRTDGKAIEARLAAAGYVTITSILKKVNGTPYNYDYNYEYAIEYLPAVGRIASNSRYYYLNRDQDNKVYAYYDDARIRTDGKAIEARLAAAGYVTITSTLKKVNGTPGNYDYNYEYAIEYVAPAGSLPGNIQYYYLNRDQDNKVYAYYDDSRIRTDGKTLEAKLKAAGNVIVSAILKKVNGTPGNYDYNYEYVIEYTVPLNGSLAEILTFELWKGRDGQPYWGWQGKSQAESDGKALEKNFQAAGYVILEAKLVQAYGEDRWGYSIRYVRPTR